MKKTLTILAVLAVLSAGAIAVCHGWVNAAREQVEIGEIIQTGDRSDVAGLTVRYQTATQDGRLLWDTAFALGGELAPESSFRFTPDRDFLPWQGGDRVDLNVASGDFASGGGGVLTDGYWRSRDMLLEPARDVAERTAAGEVRTETVRLADYYDFYPLNLSVSLETRASDGSPAWVSWSMYQADEEEYQKLERYFRIPIPADCMVTVTVEKDADGAVCQITCSTSTWEEDSAYLSQLWSAFGLGSEKGVYLLVDGGGGTSVGDSPLAVQKGIHFIPIAGREQELSSGNWGHLILDFDNIRLLHPVERGELMELRWNSDRSQLMVYTREDEKLMLTVVDAATGQVDQCLELLDWPDPTNPEEWVELTVADDGDLHAAEVNGGHFIALREEGGRCAPILVNGTGERSMAIDSQDTRLAWDGERLAVAYAGSGYGGSRIFVDTGGAMFNATGLRLEVWTAAGRQFSGVYEDLPARDPSSYVNDYYHPRIMGVVAGLSFS
ncbi:MAG: hypothetical protein K2P26_06820 [Oscillospiraceae bacterium]|nr:hypothetical protein [Oscillospiraceae bacterium]